MDCKKKENELANAMQFNDFETYPSLKSWAQTKSVSVAELVQFQGFLSLLTTSKQRQEFEKIISSYVQSNPSFSDTVHAIELVIDLVLLGRSEQVMDFNLLTNLDRRINQTKWIENLKSIRFPETVMRDQDREQKLKALPWPATFKIKAERRGDRHGVEIKTFVSSSADLVKMISSLERIKSEFPNK